MSQPPPFRSRGSSSLLAFSLPVTADSRSSVNNPTVVASNSSSSPSPTNVAADSLARRPVAHRRVSHPAPSILPPPVSYGNEKRSNQPAGSSISVGSYPYYRIRRMLSRPFLWIVLVLVMLLTWWSNGGKQELKSPEVQQHLRELFPPEITRDLHFFPAANHKIHYVGRWTTAPNRLRIDGSFPGVYFDLNITNTTSLVLSLQNAKAGPVEIPLTPENDPGSNQPPIAGQYSFSAASRLRVGAPPISLLALIDQEEYVVLPNASSLVPVRMHDLHPGIPHSVRIIAPMTDGDGTGVVQFDGLWLDKGGQLSPVEGSLGAGHADEEDDLDPESENIGKKHRLGLGSILHNFDKDEPDADDEGDDRGLVTDFRRRKKLVEILTDTPAHLKGRRTTSRSGGSDGLLAGVVGWEYLLGEMFSVDHVCIGVEGMCLTQGCVGGTGEPNGMGDVFFRSGPVHSQHFSHPWSFQAYVPDVLILNLGASDFYSFEERLVDYNKTGGELFVSFEDTYVSLIKAVRNLAYQNHPATLEIQRLGLEGQADDNAPANIPIFIMRPFLGELEHATQNAVNRLRTEGDKGVFWLDTSGWLEIQDTDTADSDFFQDPSDPSNRWHLTERGNQKVAIYLHMHVCRYLAAADEKCAFLPPEVYSGNVYDPSTATFDRYVENEKERQMKEIFWDTKNGG